MGTGLERGAAGIFPENRRAAKLRHDARDRTASQPGATGNDKSASNWTLPATNPPG